MNGSNTKATAQGMVYVHSASRALLPHLEWSLGRVLGEPIGLRWMSQPAQPGQFRAEHHWQGASSTAVEIASELAGWQEVRFEVILDANGGSEGYRWSFTPILGLHQAQIDSFGSVLLNEHQIRSAMNTFTSAALESNLLGAIGQPWDDELEPFRTAGELAPTIWLRSVSN